MTRSAGPLDGIRVLELGTLIAGPFAGRLLGDMGADVIKVEPPGAPDPLRTWGQAELDGHHVFWTVHARNKRAITLDLRRPRGRELFLDLVEKSDIVVENFRPGTLEKWNLGYDVLSATQPGHHPGPGIRLRADRARRAQGRLRLGGRGGQRAAAPQRFPGRPAAPAGALAGRQPGRHVRRPGRAGRAVPPQRHRARPGGRRRADRIMFGRTGIHDSRLRRRRRGARTVGHPAGRHRAVQHLPQRRRLVGGDRRQPGHRVRPAVQGDGPPGAGHRRPVRHARRPRPQPGRTRQDHRRVGGRTATRRHHRNPQRRRRDRGPDQHGRRGGQRPAAAGPRHAGRALRRTGRAQRFGPGHRAGAVRIPGHASATPGPARPGQHNDDVYIGLLGKTAEELEELRAEEVL